MFITDGSSKVFLVDESFSILEEKTITKDGKNVFNLNELEYYKGYLYANVYYDRRIMKIDFELGKVVESFDCLHLLQAEMKQNSLRQDEVFNGIAYHQKSGNFILTGKDWGHFYRVTL